MISPIRADCFRQICNPAVPGNLQSAVKRHSDNISYDIPRPCQFSESPARVRGTRARQAQYRQAAFCDTDETPIPFGRRLCVPDAEDGGRFDISVETFRRGAAVERDRSYFREVGKQSGNGCPIARCGSGRASPFSLRSRRDREDRARRQSPSRSGSADARSIPEAPANGLRAASRESASSGEGRGAARDRSFCRSPRSVHSLSSRIHW